MFKYSANKLRRSNTTGNQDLDFKDLLKIFELNKSEAQKRVLYNIYKFKSMQFMGLKDKNGNPIYFGDILIDENKILLTPVCEVLNGEHVLFFKPLKHLDTTLGIGCKSTYSNTLEIIGSIYKNSGKDKDLNIEISIKKFIYAQINIQIES